MTSAQLRRTRPHAAIAAAILIAWTASAPAQPAGMRPEPPFPEQYRAYLEQVFAAEAVAGDEARCKAYPDLPGNAWLPGAAQARCSLLRAPAWPLDKIEKTLKRRGGGAELDAAFAQLLQQHYDDPGQREQIFRAFSVFDHSERAGDLAQRWVRASPESGFALAALASHYTEVGLEARGTTYVNQVPAEQLQLMRDKFEQAVPLYAKALLLAPRLSVACVGMIGIGRQVSDTLEKTGIDTCQRIDPYSYYVVYAQVVSAQPAWGGSMEQMREAVNYAAANAERNPVLGALVAEADGYEIQRQEQGGTAAQWDEIANKAPSGTLMSYAAHSQPLHGDSWRALALASQSVRFWPHNVEFRSGRESILFALGRYGLAAQDALQVVRDAPDVPGHYENLIFMTERARGAGAGREYLLELAKLPGQRLGAMYRYCDGLLRTPASEERARSCVKDFAAEFPASVETRALKALMAYWHHDSNAHAVIKAFAEGERSDAPWLEEAFGSVHILLKETESRVPTESGKR